MGRQLTEEAEKAKREINKTEEERTVGEGERERRVFTKCFHYTGSGNRPHNHVGVGHELNKDEWGSGVRNKVRRSEQPCLLEAIYFSATRKNPPGGRPQLPAQHRHRTPLTPRSIHLLTHGRDIAPTWPLESNADTVSTLFAL